MQQRFIYLTALALTISSAKIQAAQTNWPQQTKQALTITHNVLTEDSAIPFVRQLPKPKEWLNQGYELALVKANAAKNAKNYRDIISFYITGFNQPHVFMSGFTSDSMKPKAYLANTKFGIKTIQPDVALVAIPTFAPTTANQINSLNYIINSISKYRNYKIIIFDVRNNPGGNSTYYRNMIYNLYTKPYLRSLGNKFVLNRQFVNKFRVSRYNINTFEKSGMPEDLKHNMLKALKNNQKLYTEKWYEISPAGKVEQHNPVSAKVAILTNNNSYSSAWLFARLIKQLPGGVQLGQRTGINGYYSNPANYQLPHGLSFSYPTSYVAEPNEGFQRPMQPNYKYNGDTNNKEFIQWALRKLR
jgi:hypothetical protein